MKAPLFIGVTLTMLLMGCTTQTPNSSTANINPNYFNTPVYYPSYYYAPYFDDNYFPGPFYDYFGYGYYDHLPR